MYRAVLGKHACTCTCTCMYVYIIFMREVTHSSSEADCREGSASLTDPSLSFLWFFLFSFSRRSRDLCVALSLASSFLLSSSSPLDTSLPASGRVLRTYVHVHYVHKCTLYMYMYICIVHTHWAHTMYNIHVHCMHVHVHVHACIACITCTCSFSKPLRLLFVSCTAFYVYTNIILYFLSHCAGCLFLCILVQLLHVHNFLLLLSSLAIYSCFFFHYISFSLSHMVVCYIHIFHVHVQFKT